MEEILSQVGLFSISLVILYIIKKVTDYLKEKEDENKYYNHKDNDEIR